MIAAAYAVPGWLATGAVVALLLGALGGLMALVAPPGRLRHTPRLDLAFAALLTGGAGWGIAHAGSVDGYFTPQARTYWQWGGTSRTPLVLGLAVAGLALVLLALGRRGWPASAALHRAALVTSGAACGLLLVGVAALSVGR